MAAKKSVWKSIGYFFAIIFFIIFGLIANLQINNWIAAKMEMKRKMELERIENLDQKDEVPMDNPSVNNE